MAAAAPAERSSASKLRRIRQAETKQRLYKTASQDQCLAAIHTQLAMLTSTIDNLYHNLIHVEAHVAHCHPYCWNSYAKEFTPNSHQSYHHLEQWSLSEPAPLSSSDAVAAPTEDVLEEALPGPIGDSYAISCDVCWEALPIKYGCHGVHLCKHCAAAGGRSTVGTDANADGNHAHISSQSLSTWASLVSQAGSCEISGIEFYDSCRLVVATLAGEGEPLILHLPPGELKDFLEKARLHSIGTKSYLGKKYAKEASSKRAAPKASAEPDLHASRLVSKSCEAATQTRAIYECDPDGAVTLTLPEAERLWAGKHQELLAEFESMLTSQAEYYENKFGQVSAHTHEMFDRVASRETFDL